MKMRINAFCALGAFPCQPHDNHYRTQKRLRTLAVSALIAALVTLSTWLLGGQPVNATEAPAPHVAGIVIEVESLPSSTTQFAFTHNVDGSGLFALTSGSAKSFPAVTPGQYTVVQGDSGALYDVTDVVCTDSDSSGIASTGDRQTRVAVINLDPGEIVTCRFVNSRRGAMVIAQENNPAAAADFSYTAPTTGVGNFTLADGHTRTINNLPAGEYTVTQLSGPPGWILDKIVCDDGAGSNPSVVDIAMRSAKVKVDPGETVTCAFAVERPGLILTDSHAGIDLDEATGASYGGIACYWVNLASKPDKPVRVVIQPDAQVAVSRSEVILTSSNWDGLAPLDLAASNRVCVTPIPDHISEHGAITCVTAKSDVLGSGGNDVALCGDHIAHIDHTIVTDDAPYSHASLPVTHIGPNLDNDDLTVDVLLRDDEAAAVIIAESDGSSQVTEGSNGYAGYTVRLSSQPRAVVKVAIYPDAQLQVDRTELVFGSNTWMTPQLIRVAAVNDDLAEGVHTAEVTHAVNSDDASYDDPGVTFVGNGVAPDPRVVLVEIMDDDIAGLETNPTQISVVEGSTSGYAVRLTSRPAADVTVDMTSGDGRLGFSPASLVFNPANWAKAQNVTVRAADNDVYEGTLAATVRHSTTSDSPPFDGLNGVTIDVLVVDNDRGGVAVMPDALEVSESGGDAGYQVFLTGRPTQTVTVTPQFDAQQLRIVPAELIFTPESWDNPQVFVVRAVDDDVAEGTPDVHTEIVTHTVASRDAAFDAVMAPRLSVTILENDMPGVVFSTQMLDLIEGPGGYGSYAVKLTSRPRAEVTVQVLADPLLNVSPTALVFTADNWDLPQDVNVVVVDDAGDEAIGDAVHLRAVAHAVQSADPVYDGFDAGEVLVSITENDAAAVIVSSTSASVSEGGAVDTVTLVLATRPHAVVEVTAVPDTQVTTVPARVIFTPDNWAEPVPILVRALDDALDESTTPQHHQGRLAFHVTGADANYRGIDVAGVDVDIVDNDDIGLLMTARHLALFENGAQGADLASFGVRLTAAPSHTLTVRVLVDDQVQVAGGEVLTFDLATWMIPQLVVVRAVDDSVAEGLHRAHVQLQYLGGTTGDELRTALVNVSLADDDAPSVFVAPLELVARVEPGATPSELYYTVRLTTMPTATVRMVATAPSGLTVNGGASAELVFDAGNWLAPQPVLVGLNPAVLHFGPPILAVEHLLESSDPNYAGQAVADVLVDAQQVFMQGDPDADGFDTRREDRDADGNPTNDDTDGDGTADFLDDDDDGDGRPTVIEGEADDDRDGIPNYLDSDDATQRILLPLLRVRIQ